MTFTFTFTRTAEKKFSKLEKNVQERIRNKLLEIKEHEYIVGALKPLTNYESATHRLRVGEYRLILQKQSDHDFVVVDCGHRGEIYK